MLCMNILLLSGSVEWKRLVFKYESSLTKHRGQHTSNQNRHTKLPSIAIDFTNMTFSNNPATANIHRKHLFNICYIKSSSTFILMQGPISAIFKNESEPVFCLKNNHSKDLNFKFSLISQTILNPIKKKEKNKVNTHCNNGSFSAPDLFPLLLSLGFGGTLFALDFSFLTSDL